MTLLQESNLPDEQRTPLNIRREHNGPRNTDMVKDGRRKAWPGDYFYRNGKKYTYDGRVWRTLG